MSYGRVNIAPVATAYLDIRAMRTRGSHRDAFFRAPPVVVISKIITWIVYGPRSPVKRSGRSRAPGQT
jgi:hypothetical protein